VLFEEALSWITGTLITVFVKSRVFEQKSVAEQPAHNLGTENSVKN
jgi:glycerol-3-phosphate acyltransferase PlsY